ncbi:A/G-specific adenine glycosylase [Urechidicola croceus]|uniref:Adenine DNA glycosylase n=1 Tax=Urechidicola croceus TaxID=1850246 RepID=A0A1D8P8F7_9FLAO|nr:A/G-specific adenine glycosylase [Urechidicola croceus]AOW20858.1 A/G-specific adenine glycosylase [Urechidicola croceus]
MHQTTTFSNALIHWYLRNKRDLPWRKTTNPYHIWLSEIILQQTRVEQGYDYYLRFIMQFPTVFDLANSPEQEVLNLWQGLGYYSRARNLHFSAKYIVEELNGVFPSTYDEILKLKGVGDYTASAIASICFNEPTAVVDGNVYRGLSRYFGISTPINSTKGIKEFKILAQFLINHSNPATHNQAIMEFGARMCKPQNPLCTECPFNESCFALAKNKIKELPVKEKKIKIKKRHFNYLVLFTPKNKTIINQRIGKGIWQNLYEFPLIESKKKIDEIELIEHNTFKELFENKNTIIRLFNTEEKVHKLSHQHLYTQFWIVKIDAEISNTTDWNKLEEFPIPRLIDNFINEIKQTEIFSTFE